MTKKQILDTTVFKTRNSVGYFQPLWKIGHNDENNTGKIKIFIRATNMISPNSNSGSTRIRLTGDSFMYTGAKCYIYGRNVFVSFERPANFQSINYTF